MLGSVAEKVAHHANMPVLILREHGPILAEQEAGETERLQVYVPLDGSAFAEAALVPAAVLASVLSAPGQGNLYLTRIVHPGAAEMEEAKHYLESTSSSAIIAFTTHGHGGQALWATGSVAGRVLHATQLPLLIVRPAELV